MSAELNRHLELLDEEQLGTVITDYVDFCKNQLSGQFSPLIKVLQVTNYRITGEQMHGGHIYNFKIKKFPRLIQNKTRQTGTRI